MNTPRLPDAARRARRRALLWLAVALGATAYRPLLASAVQLPTTRQFESWLFRPSQLPTIFVLGVAGWLVWRRRARLHALPPRRHWIAAALATAGAALFVWALLTRSIDLLLPSLAANGLAVAAGMGGRAGVRTWLLPALVLLLGVPIPAPLRHEIVWRLQLATASGASWLLDAIGREFIREGVILRNVAHSFQVIDGCSGLQGMATLFGVAVIACELFALSAVRAAVLLASAPALGYALNAVRIAYVAASPNPEIYAGVSGDHTPQGVALLAAGTALIYALGRALAPPGTHAPRAREPEPPAPARSPLAAAGLAAVALLALFSFALTPFSPGPTAHRQLAFPEGGAGWTSARLVADPYFFPPSPGAPWLHRRYQLGVDADPPYAVELLIRVEALGAPDTGDLSSSKLTWPGPEWDLQSRSRTRIWDLSLDAELASAARGDRPERAVIYAWRLRDEGLLRESLRALFALDASPLRRETPRAVVRLVAVAPFDEPLALARAKRRMDGFITAFRAPLAAL